MAFEALTWTIAGKPTAFLRQAETGLTVSAGCRTKGKLQCQAVSALAGASHRSAESARHGVGSVDCGDFQAARVDPSDGQPVCRFADGSMIRLEDLDHWAQAKDDWDQSVADPVTQQLPRLSACLARVRYASVGTLRFESAVDDKGKLAKPQIERPQSGGGADWPTAQRCLLGALGELHFEKPPALVAPQVAFELELGA